MFAIIDIETCGTNFEFRKGRITEICILKHDGLSVIDRFTTLINPECYISPYFTKLTNITNEMVADAPRFHEVAEKILEMTEGCVFVAHNVGFDYGFIKEEFKSLGYTYKRDTLCTVRLSRKLMPGRISYSLGHLCASLGIEIFGRHRAEGDAVATAQLFDLLIQLKTQHPQYKNMGVTEIMTRKVDKIKQYVLNKLPEECGVYYFRNKEGEVIYIGKSNNMYQRAQAHFNNDAKKSKKMLNDLHSVDFELTGSELIALLYESEEIKKHKPKYNRMRKAEEFTHSLGYFKDDKGILNLRISESDMVEEPLVSYASYSSARSRLEAWLEEKELCLRFCGLTGEKAVCFNHQIKKCRGICADEEVVEEYNKRVETIIKEFEFPYPDFVVLDKGRKTGEYSVVLVEKNRYKGFGYFDESAGFQSPEELRGQVGFRPYYPDTGELLRHFVKKGKGKLIKLAAEV
ncbi:MAG: exonuclease domain-containing protein [Bacteroidia bacterium]|nr:exonuclease domain-containing protein [Bacteroidia bacterium]